MTQKQEEVMNLVAKYKEKLQSQLAIKDIEVSKKPITREYKQFRQESMPAHMSWYEKSCNFCEKIIK